MLPLRYARHWQLGSVILLLLVLIAALMPAAVWFWSDGLSVGDWVRNADKWAHGLTFVVLALWFSGMYSKSSYWKVAIGLLAFGVLIEVLQGLVRYRMAEWLDIGADTLGIAIGLALALAGPGGWCLRFEAWRDGREGALD
ncbi:MAG: VanZ family protein [Woeseiaceae bacterium]|nr:VanZ family protein [Woeseiaceae bacterium]